MKNFLNLIKMYNFKHSMAKKSLPLLLRTAKFLYSVPEISFSQNCEDLIIKMIFQGQDVKGFYVDVGAHHPIRFSNTYLLYTEGWGGYKY